MDTKITLLFSFFLLFSCSNAFNITLILSQFKEFSTFNDYLIQTQVASEINSRQTITILAVDNSAMPSLSGKSTDIAKKIMSVHVVLDYYDIAKLKKLPNKTATLTTLFQSSGQASGQQGFLNATVSSTGQVALASGSTIGANVMKTVVAQPYNVSVLQISTAIIPMGITEGNSSAKNSTSPPPHSNNNNSPGPAPGPGKTPPAKSPKTAPPPRHPGTAPVPSADVADAPAPVLSPSDAPAADEADGKKKSFGVALGSGVFVIVASLFFSLVSIV